MISIVEFDRTGRRRTMIRAILGFCVAATAFLPIAASAHVVAGDSHGFLRGFSHPLGGIDHVLAMIAVGLFAARLGGRALWLVPLSFLSVMALAGIAGMAGVELPLVQVGIGLSLSRWVWWLHFNLAYGRRWPRLSSDSSQSFMVTPTG